MHYQLSIVRDAGHDVLVVSESVGPGARCCWGTYVFRAGVPVDEIVAVARPLFEQQTYEYGVQLFESRQAAVLLLAGAHPACNADGASDVTRFKNRRNVFQLAHQVLLRECGSRPQLIISVRAIDHLPGFDALLSLAGTTDLPPVTTGRLDRLLRELSNRGLQVERADGPLTSSKYELSSSLQGAALRLNRNKTLATLWLSPDTRRHFRSQQLNLAEETRFQAMGIPTRIANLEQVLLPPSSATMPPAEMQLQICEAVQHYLDYRDVVALYRLQKLAPDWQWRRIIDSISQQAFLVGTTPEGITPIVVSLADTTDTRSRWTVSSADWRESIREFVTSPTSWLDWSLP